MRDKSHGRVRWLGLLNQEAHAQDIWPIGFDVKDSFCATYTLETRLKRLEVMLRVFPELGAAQGCDEWFLDIPTTTYYHVGGTFNDVLGVWPHHYLVFQGTRLIFRSAYHYTGPGQYHIDVQDLVLFLQSLR